MAKIALLGYGKTNKAILKSSKKKFDIFDDSFTNVSTDKLGNTFYPSSYFNQRADIYKKQVITPGIAPSNPLAKNSKNLISEYDYLKKRFAFSIWISGTNGKTTLTQMIHHLLGKKISQMGANIGKPIALMNSSKPIWILETSSFSMHYTNEVYPNIYLLLPINDDHLSWHGSFEQYERAKLKPLSMMDKSNIAILPECYKNIKTNAYTIYYKDEKQLAKYMGIDIEKITIQRPFKISAVLALSAQKILFDKCDIPHCNTFKIDSHKMERFKDNKNRDWIDDSKATNISACKEAIKAYGDRKIHIILGGDSKQVSLKPLVKFMQDYDIYIYSIGSSANEIENLAKKYNISCKNCENIKEAVLQIDKLLDNKSISILSPACASLDQFSSYKQRGEVFKKIVHGL